MPPITDLSTLLGSLEPELRPGTYVFATLAPGQHVPVDDLVAMMREREGVTVVVAEPLAERLGVQPVLRCAWITLTVHSDLHAVGLTTAFARALGDAGVSCNVVAGVHHDHLFVPVAEAAMAMRALQRLQLDHQPRSA